MKSTLIFILFVLIVLGLLFAISGKRVPPPAIPDDSFHNLINDPTLCLSCHGQRKEAAMKKIHPPKYECFKCHKVKKEGSKG